GVGGAQPRATRRRWAPWVVGAAVAVAAITLTLWRFLPSRPATGAPHEADSAARTGATEAGAAPQKSIAVLPFADMSEKKDQEYFADGMAEDILDLLATIPALRVIGRTSSFQFKARNEDLRTISAQLDAAYLVAGR